VPVDPTLLEPFDKLVQVTIEGRCREVPANNSVLRVLQYLEVDLYPCRLCWNGDCDNCRFTYLDPATGSEVTARGCETGVCPGMQILRIPENAAWPAPAAEER
jgi:predicted molibdopterin-dependent oxidoreductase YjgC